MENKILVSCPPFSTQLVDIDKVTVRRDYSHPVDSKVIEILDSPTVNMIFRPLLKLTSEATMGQIIATSISVNQSNYPELDEIVNQCVAYLGIRRPYVVVSTHVPGFNAITFGSDEEPYIALSSMIVRLMTYEQMQFVIGHECGHIAMGHLIYHSVVNAAGNVSSLLPVIGPIMYHTVSLALNAWCRRSEITADRAGLLCCGNLETAKKALMRIELAFGDENNVDIDAYVKESKRYLQKGILRRVSEYTSSHPLTPKRIEALELFTHSRKYGELTGATMPAYTINDEQLVRETEHIISVMEV